MKDQWYCRYAPSLGALEGTPEEAWGTPPYDRRKHRYKPCVFFGLYDARDFYALWRHKGKAAVLFAGSDIRNLASGFVFNDGKLYWLSYLTRGWFRKWLVRMLRRKAYHWVENETEKQALWDAGIAASGVVPSYMGNVRALKRRYKPASKLHVFLCSPEGRQREYGFGVVERIADRVPFCTFHLYGAAWTTRHKNVTVHGRVPKEQMNLEIRRYHVGLRPNEFDGASEITVKAVLMGKWALTRVKFPRIPHYTNDDELVAWLTKFHREKKGPPKELRYYYQRKLNAYPWANKEWNHKP